MITVVTILNKRLQCQPTERFYCSSSKLTAMAMSSMIVSGRVVEIAINRLSGSAMSYWTQYGRLFLGLHSKLFVISSR
jgi:hypothetical protein